MSVYSVIDIVYFSFGLEFKKLLQHLILLVGIICKSYI